VRVPKRVREEPQPPSADEVRKIFAAIPAKRRLLFIVLEQGALRLGGGRQPSMGGCRHRRAEAEAAPVRDEARQEPLVYLPDWLMQAIDVTCPLEDRIPERKVFPGISEAAAYQQMLRACQTAGVAHY
jgi:hypothetical protein